MPILPPYLKPCIKVLRNKDFALQKVLLSPPNHLSQTVADSIINNGMSACDNNYLLDYYRLSADNRLLFCSDSSSDHHMIDIMRKNMLHVFPHLEQVKINTVGEAH